MVLVTGGARRVGRAIVEGLAGAGARLAIHCHTGHRLARELAEALGRDRPAAASVFPADLRDGREAEALAKRVVSEMGRLDVLINSAAVMARQPFGSITPEGWDRVLQLNLRAYFFTIQGAADELSTRRGKVINISDVAAFEAWSEYLPHSVSKTGVEMLTKGLARTLAPAVTVNAVAPGPVLLPEAWSEDARERVERSSPLERLGEPSDVLEAVRYLIASDYVTGSTLVVDGGQLIRARR